MRKRLSQRPRARVCWLWLSPAWRRRRRRGRRSTPPRPDSDIRPPLRLQHPPTLRLRPPLRPRLDPRPITTRPSIAIPTSGRPQCDRRYQAGGPARASRSESSTRHHPALSEFAGKIDTPAATSPPIAGSRRGRARNRVSAVAAAARNGSNTLGVAFDATIVSMRADAPGTCADTSEDGGCEFHDSAIAAGIDDRPRRRGAGDQPVARRQRPQSTLMAAMNRAVAAGVVLVISAGNDGEEPEGANADPMAVVPAQTFGRNVIIAGSVGVADGSGGTNLNQISVFSNRAGNGASWYLAALGYRDRAPDHTGDQFLWSGTSFSARPSAARWRCCAGLPQPHRIADRRHPVRLRDDLERLERTRFSAAAGQYRQGVQPLGQTASPTARKAVSTPATATCRQRPGWRRRRR